MNLREQIYTDYIREITEHYEENRAAAEVMKEELQHTPLISCGRLIDKPLAIQKVYTREDDRRFREIVEMTHRICCKVIDRYVADPGYPDELPMARFDIFYHEDTGDFKFCEINTDGTSAMNEDFHLDKLNLRNPAHQAICRKYRLRSYELFDSWVETFLELYTHYRKKHPEMPLVPTVAIVDFLDKGNVPEFYEFAARFRQKGIYAQVSDIRSLRYEDGRLLAPEGYEIHGIYRRAVTADVMEEYDSVTALLDAYRDGNIFLCGSFRTQVAHAKTFFTMLHREETREILTAEENRFVREHVPYTCDFGDEGIALEKMIQNKDKYILKPNDSYGSNSVADGKGRSSEEWRKLCEAYYNKGFICQEYAEQYATPNVDFMFGDGRTWDYINMNGLYSYNGNFAGVFTRQARGTIIASHGSERNVASYLVTE